MKMDQLVEEDKRYTFVNPITFVLQFLANYGWYIVGAAAVSIYLVQKLKPKYKRWQEAREDAAYHKDPDKVMVRLEAIQRAREQQQQLLEEASRRAALLEEERQQRKRQENLERLQKYGAGGGRRLGAEGDGYLPLSGGAAPSSYRPPKRSACARGGCGR